jgi:hypothetical protein
MRAWRRSRKKAGSAASAMPVKTLEVMRPKAANASSA